MHRSTLLLPCVPQPCMRAGTACAAATLVCAACAAGTRLACATPEKMCCAKSSGTLPKQCGPHPPVGVREPAAGGRLPGRPHHPVEHQRRQLPPVPPTHPSPLAVGACWTLIPGLALLPSWLWRSIVHTQSGTGWETRPVQSCRENVS